MADEISAKRPKMTGESTTTCAHWVERKKRYCKMTVNKGSEFCGAHAPANKSSEIENSDAERIPCPLDPNHTVFKRKLEKHLSICNAREQQSTLPYIEKGINAGDALLPEDEVALADYQKLKLHELEDSEFYGVIDKVNRLYTEHIENTIDELQLQHKSLERELKIEDYGQESRKHLIQTAALLGILEHDKQLASNTSFIEFGAGKGQLAYYLASVLESMQLGNSQVVLLDRLSLRHKKDNKVANKELVQRIRADIADFKMSQLPELHRTQHNVALSKHLCGAATDLTLRCVLGKEATNTDYILIALCCHHRCEWRSYVGKQWLQTTGITPREFVIITKMVSWAVCGTGLSRERRKAMAEDKTRAEQEDTEEQQQPSQRLSREQREEIGYKCKRVLDHGRLKYLQQHGYNAALKFYVPRDVTLENVVLLARQKDNS
ncbi:tRNA:m(4)X modification enzyme TRM13 homolog [Scaptodrosophila lebanonensis]|uniref:tRNA:m(4)X modification enzyme TRM13 n=1 Tax=Drosophila lebanonensis TaxID=7225 RepID=A0A6J2T968_DROLE|nr:tRNA:m(4)X modification enzyme TRM13 homolog [Scaptodrosophila lebanonensis]